MFQPAENKVVVKVATKYIHNITNITRLSALQQGASIDMGDLVQIVGEIVSLPKQIKEAKEYVGYSLDNIKVGDTGIFSYQVIQDTTYIEDEDKVIYKNMIVYEGQEYFLVDITRLFGVIRDGNIIMLNGYVMLSEYPQNILLLQNQSKKAKGTVISEILYIGNPKTTELELSLQQGDNVCFSPFYPQHYQINNKKFIILQQNHIFGVV
jgi:co-chaperonin GroES (HSP10)